jgi:hypothetical protein
MKILATASGEGARMSPALQGLLTIIIGVSGCVGYFYGANLLLDKVLFPAKGPIWAATSTARI